MDRSNAGPYSNSTMQGGVMPLPPLGLWASSVTLRVFVDHSIVEVGLRCPPWHICILLMLCARLISLCTCLYMQGWRSTSSPSLVPHTSQPKWILRHWLCDVNEGNRNMERQSSHTLLACLQVYALGGRGRVTSRIYPLGLNIQWGVAAFGSSGSLPVSANLTAWDMGSAFNDTHT